jgi:hypothetical protein
VRQFKSKTSTTRLRGGQNSFENLPELLAIGKSRQSFARPIMRRTISLDK